MKSRLVLLVLAALLCHTYAVKVQLGSRVVDLKTDKELRQEEERRLIALGCDPCPAGEYMLSACAGGSDTTPVCSSCSGACPSGQTLVEPCGATNDRVCAPKEHSACASKAVTLDMGALSAITEDTCDSCGQHLTNLNTALKEGYMACPLRLSAYVAQVRHSTANFNIMRGSSPPYVAGAIHMTPASYRLACKQIPDLKAAFQSSFASCVRANKCDCGGDSEAAAIVGRSEFAFKTGVWWFSTGANQLLGDPCGDLRLDADWGLGGAPHWTSRESPGTGFQKTTTCIAGFGSDPGRQQRANYYVAARAYFPDQDPDPVFSAASTATTSVTLLVVGIIACLLTML